MQLKKQLGKLAVLPEDILPRRLHGTLMVVAERTTLDFKVTQRIPMGYLFY